MGDLGSIPGLGRSPGEGKGYSLEYSGLENSINSIVHGVTKSQTCLSDFHLLTHLQLNPFKTIIFTFKFFKSLGINQYIETVIKIEKSRILLFKHVT